MPSRLDSRFISRQESEVLCGGITIIINPAKKVDN